MATANLMTVLDSAGKPIREGDKVRFSSPSQVGYRIYANAWLVGQIEHVFYKNDVPHLIVRAGMYTHVVKACKVFKDN